MTINTKVTQPSVGKGDRQAAPDTSLEPENDGNVKGATWSLGGGGKPFPRERPLQEPFPLAVAGDGIASSRCADWRVEPMRLSNSVAVRSIGSIGREN